MPFARVAAVGLVIATVVAAPAVQAQKDKDKGEGEGLLVGPSVGLNFAGFNASGISGVTFSGHAGLAIGGEVEHGLGSQLFLRVGLVYSMRGSAFDATGSGGGTGTIKLNLIEVPAMVGYRFATGTRVVPYVMGGAQLGFKSGCTVEGGGTSADCNTSLGGTVPSTDVGLTFGGGVGLPAGSGTLKVDARYLVGLTNLVSAAGSGSLKDKGVTLAVAYMFPLGR